jgi:ribosomal protein S18 acetylase RimI-like enzyme
MMPVLTEKPLTADLVDQALDLSAAAGWNQVAADWRLMLGQGWGVGLAPPGRALVGTALTVTLQPRLAWISMVLVDGAWRRRGVGTRLLQRCIAHLREDGLVAGLDATEAGRLVYRPLGFETTYFISRLRLEAIDAVDAPVPAGLSIEPIAAADLPALAAWDSARSGFARAAILSDLHRRLPASAWIARDGARIAGYVLGRDGRLTAQFGPLVADDPATARALLGRAIAGTRQAALLDVPDEQAALHDWLRALGAVRQRGYARMILGPPSTIGPPDAIYAIAGPELG